MSVPVAREQGALFWELRAALGAARLLVRQENRAGAAQVLQPVYDLGRFLEAIVQTSGLRPVLMLIAARCLLSRANSCKACFAQFHNR